MPAVGESQINISFAKRSHFCRYRHISSAQFDIPFAGPIYASCPTPNERWKTDKLSRDIEFALISRFCLFFSFLFTRKYLPRRRIARGDCRRMNFYLRQRERRRAYERGCRTHGDACSDLAVVLKVLGSPSLQHHRNWRRLPCFCF